MFNISIFFFFFFFNAPATTEIYTLSLHDALPIFYTMSVSAVLVLRRKMPQAARPYSMRSEEHTSELQSLTNLVCRLLLEKKKKKKNQNTSITKMKRDQQILKQ